MATTSERASRCRKARRHSSGAPAFARPLVGYAFVLLPMAIFLIFFIYPLVYAIYISLYDWGVLGKIERGRARELPRRSSTTSLSGGRLKNTLELHGWSSSRSRWRSACSLARRRQREDPRAARSSARRSTSPRSRPRPRSPRSRSTSSTRRPPERDHRRQPALVRRLRHRALVDHGPERLDDVGHDDALLPRRAAVDPDGRLRGGRDRRRRAPGGRSGRSRSRCSSRRTSSCSSSRSSAR